MAVTSKQDIRAMKVIESTAREKKIPLATSGSVNIDVIETTLKGSRFMFNGVEIDLRFRVIISLKMQKPHLRHLICSVAIL